MSHNPNKIKSTIIKIAGVLDPTTTEGEHALGEAIAAEVLAKDFMSAHDTDTQLVDLAVAAADRWFNFTIECAHPLDGYRDRARVQLVVVHHLTVARDAVIAATASDTEDGLLF